VLAVVTIDIVISLPNVDQGSPFRKRPHAAHRNSPRVIGKIGCDGQWHETRIRDRRRDADKTDLADAVDASVVSNSACWRF
jgi:hypothetical protein